MDSCIPNIGPHERRRRLRSGLLSLAAAVALGGILAGSAIWLRALVFLPLLGAAYGVFQYLEKT